MSDALYTAARQLIEWMESEGTFGPEDDPSVREPDDPIDCNGNSWYTTVALVRVALEHETGKPKDELTFPPDVHAALLSQLVGT